MRATPMDLSVKARRKMRLEEFLRQNLDEAPAGRVIEWVDREDGVFRILWTHQSSGTFTLKDAALFRYWALARGKPANLSSVELKQSLRMALNKSPSVERVEGSHDEYRYFRFTGWKSKMKQEATRTVASSISIPNTTTSQHTFQQPPPAFWEPDEGRHDDAVTCHKPPSPYQQVPSSPFLTPTTAAYQTSPRFYDILHGRTSNKSHQELYKPNILDSLHGTTSNESHQEPYKPSILEWKLRENHTVPGYPWDVQYPRDMSHRVPSTKDFYGAEESHDTSSLYTNPYHLSSTLYRPTFSAYPYTALNLHGHDVY